MEKLNTGDLVVTLPKVENIKSIAVDLRRGMIGVVVDHTAKFNEVVVYGVAIGQKVYWLFEDEIKKLEKEC